MDILPDDGRRLNAADGSGQVIETATAPEPAEEQPAPRPLRLHVTQERVERLNWGLSRRAQQGDLDAMSRVIAHFAFRGSSYMETDEALALLDKKDRGEVRAIVDELFDRMEGVAVGGDPK